MSNFSISPDFFHSGCIFEIEKGIFFLGYGIPVFTPRPLRFPCIFFSNFNLSSPAPYGYYPQHCFCTQQELSHYLKGVLKNEDFLTRLAIWSDADFSLFEKDFYALQSAFHKSDLKKLVLRATMSGSLPTSKDLTIHLLNSILKSTKDEKRWTYGIWNSDPFYVLLGATPELLFEREGNYFQTMALAGTVSLDVADDLFLKDEKLKQEHMLVVQSILESLKNYKISVSSTKLLKLKKFKHMVTRIKGFSRGLSFEQLLIKLHPTAALGVYPRHTTDIFAQKYLAQFSSSSFGSPIGLLLNENHQKVWVAIRNIEIRNSRIDIQAGCGIVAQSNLEEEKKELLKKINSIKATFQLW